MTTTAPLQNIAAKSSLVSKSFHAGLLLQRKCACGEPVSSSLTGECEECKNKHLQKKLSIGASNDPLEQEADRVADQVMAAPLNSAVNATPPRIQRFSVQASEGENAAPPSVDRVLSGSGRPLDLTLQQDMGQRFGHDFSQVRVHTGSAAEQSARDVNAHAYTVGNNVVFGAERFAPGSHDGRKLIAHELTHVVQSEQLQYFQSNAMTGNKQRNRLNNVIRRYGHDMNSCKDNDHLKPYIWPGHFVANKSVANTIQILEAIISGRIPISEYESNLKNFFGNESTLPTNLASILNIYKAIYASLNNNYLYRCANPCIGDHRGARAWTEDSGNKDITLCFNKIIAKSYSVIQIAQLIIHENVHRSGIWGHEKELTDDLNCDLAMAKIPIALRNPDSYACMAIVIGK